MAIHWQIPFKSLRTGTVYTVNVYDSSYSGDAVVLKGGVNTFVTEEEGSEDEFIPIRTQTGYLRVVDDGKDASGNALADGWWKSLVPNTDTDRPVTLTDGGGTVYWIGFIQAQNFSGELYGGTQERQFPVQCALSALSSIQAPTDQVDMQNFAYLMRHIFNQMANQIPISTPFTTYVFQGGADARKWLQKLFDWHNFLTIDDNGITAKYTLYQILEDVCRFWGWTCRTWRQQIIFTCADDINETNALVLYADPNNTNSIDKLADNISGTSTAGSVQSMFTTKVVGNIFASANIEDMKVRGVSRAEVKSDCNKSNELLEFAPQSVRDTMEQGGYIWVQPGDDALIGYFTTPEIASFDSQTLAGSVSSSANGGFCRRQIYSDEKATEATIADMIAIRGNYNNGTAFVHLETKRERIFSGGSLRMSGTIYEGHEVYTTDDRLSQRNMLMRIGIGTDVNHAKWFYLQNPLAVIPFYGWTDTRVGSEFRVKTTFSMCYEFVTMIGDFPQIPVPDNIYGKVFVDFCGCDSSVGISDNFQIADFKIEYSRDSASLIGQRTRTIEKDRVSTQKYFATNLNKCDEKWNADCIFASDNNMEYGYGLIMNPSDGSTDAGKFMYQAQYGSAHYFPEQYLASRVSSFWANSRRLVSAPLLSNGLCGDVAAGNISPRHKLTIDGTTCHPIAISHDWHEDITTVKLLQI